MLRIADLKILCPICNKPDGCLVAGDGGAVICARIEEGSIKKVGKGRFRGGFLHITGDFTPKKYEAPEKPDINWGVRNTRYVGQLYANKESFYSMLLEQRISMMYAMRFNIGWNDGCITIPVYSMSHLICGIQKRRGNEKRYMEWSDMGVFVPMSFFQNTSKTLAVAEGWSDTIAAMMYGFNAIGKVNAFVGSEEVVLYARSHPTIERVIIFADDNEDGVGLEGAEETAGLLEEKDFPTKLVLTPRKDLRDCRLNKMSLNEVMGN